MVSNLLYNFYQKIQFLFSVSFHNYVMKHAPIPYSLIVTNLWDIIRVVLLYNFLLVRFLLTFLSPLRNLVAKVVGLW